MSIVVDEMPSTSSAVLSDDASSMTSISKLRYFCASTDEMHGKIVSDALNAGITTETQSSRLMFEALTLQFVNCDDYRSKRPELWIRRLKAIAWVEFNLVGPKSEGVQVTLIVPTCHQSILLVNLN
jgi:hypothetical protein